MATFTEIYYNGNEYKQMWLNGSKVWQKASGGGEIVYPYPDVDSVVTFRNTSTSSQGVTFEVIDSTLPYSINGTSTKSFKFPANSETQVKFVNLKPRSNASYVIPINIEQLRIPKLTDLSYLFYYFCYDSNYTYSWSPQYFEFNENPTSMSKMFYFSKITNDMMNQLMPYFPNTSKVTDMSWMFTSCSKLTSLDLSSFDTSNVTNMEYMFYYCSNLTSLNLSSFDTSKVTNMGYAFQKCSSLTSLDVSSFDTSKVISMSYMFDTVSNCTIYIGDKWTLGTSSTLGNGTNLTFIERQIPITSIDLTCDVDVTNITTPTFTIISTITPKMYTKSDLEIVYDETYMNIDNNKVILKDGCQGQTLSITYRSKENNSISDTLTFTVSQDLEFPTVIDFTQSTAPELPSYITLDGQGSSYYFSHGTYTTNVYGLVPNNSGMSGLTAYTRYKYVAPKDGVLTFTYRCYSEADYDYLIVHVNKSTSQPSYNGSTNRVLTTYGVYSYKDTDGTASINVTQGTTYYIHIQYRKNNSGDYGYDKGCIRKIELL